MRISSTQSQWATGQGFFHTGAIRRESVKPSALLTYAMDCGAIGSQGPVRREVDALATHVAYEIIDRPLDVAFLSHFDWDHISGIQRLHAVARPRVYVIPSTTIIERIYIAARIGNHSVAGPIPAWYWELLSEPRVWIERLEGGPRVIEVTSQPERNWQGDYPAGYLPESEQAIGLDLPRLVVAPRPSLPSGSYIAAVVDNHAGAPQSFSVPIWVLQSYVTNAAVAHLENFEKRLSSTVPDYPRRKHKAEVLNWLVEEHWDELLAAYDASSKVRNLTSLCVYSGPAPSMKPYTRVGHSSWGSPSNPVPSGAGPGWLGAGDAALDLEAEADAFVAAFASVLHHVGTFAVPHHGARSSWNDVLIEAFTTRSIPPPAAIVGARPGYRGWKHPSLEVIRALGDHGAALRVVTDQEASRWSTWTYVEL